MGQIYGKATKGLGLAKGFLFITGLISMMLAFANIFPLPLPVLDGGHVVFLLFEWITGKPVPLKVFFIAQNIGIVLVLGLMVLTNLNDILRIFGI
jgi:regulator of sigma E protease